MLVAGGLGERLGYSGIKIALPTDLARTACFLKVPTLHPVLKEGNPEDLEPTSRVVHLKEPAAYSVPPAAPHLPMLRYM